MSVMRRTRSGWLVLGLACLVSAPAQAEVTRFDVTSRTPIVGFDYERVVGRIHFAVDSDHARNRIIVDLNKATRGADGRVEFAADFYMLRPTSGGNGSVLVDIVNRGRLTFGRFGAPRATSDQVGDGFLLRRGFTVVAIGWESDVASTDGLLRLDAPIATEGGEPITGLVGAMFIPNGQDATVVGALAGFTPVAPEDPESVLTVRDDPSAPVTTIQRSRWTVSSTNRVTLEGGFEPGRMYELTYKVANPPVAGLGFAAVRDAVSWLRRGTDSMPAVQFAHAFGASQSGRFLREFLYEGFNTDERGDRVFDGVMAHIAGAARLDLNSRWSTPVECCTIYSTSFPFSTTAQRDPLSSIAEGLLDNDRARANQPKLFLTNTSVEYWSSGGRAAALTHTTPDGTRDITETDVRVYLLAGTQHGTGPFPPTRGNGQELLNPTNQSWVLRALLVAMDDWVREDVDPPASRRPRLDEGTLVDVKSVAFPAIPGVHSPLGLDAGARTANPFLTGGAGAGAKLPLLVSQVDADGNGACGDSSPRGRRSTGHLYGLELPRAGRGWGRPRVSLVGIVHPVRAHQGRT